MPQYTQKADFLIESVATNFDLSTLRFQSLHWAFNLKDANESNIIESTLPLFFVSIMIHKNQF